MIKFFIVLAGVLAAAAVSAADDWMPEFKMPRVSEPKVPRLTLNIANFGAVPDGKTLNSEAIAKGIATLSERGGGKLVFPPGIWLTGPIELKSRIQLHVEEGALVLFTTNHSQYPSFTFDMKGRSRTVTASPIYGENLEDIAITGRGVFDGAGDSWRPVKKSKMTERQWRNLIASGGVIETNGNEQIWSPYPGAESRRPRLLKLVNCRRILLEDATFQNSPGWNLNPTLCDDITIRGITVRNPWYSQNGDGLDLEHCRNVILRDSRFDVGDDAICLKSGANEEGRRIGMPTENVLIENCIVYHGHGGVTVGSEMSSGVRNVRVNNCTFIGTDIGLRFKSTRGRGGVVEKIYISNVRMTDIATDAIGFNLFYGGQAPTEQEAATSDASSIPVTEATPQFRDIWIENVICRGARTAVAVQGLPEMPVRGLHFRNVSITSERGFVCASAKDITLDNVEILNSTGPAISLASSREIEINRLVYMPGVETVIKGIGTGSRNVVVRNTDFKAAAKDFAFSGGASPEQFKVE